MKDTQNIKLINTYEALNLFEKCLVQLCAVMDNPGNRTEIFNAYRCARLPLPKKGSFRYVKDLSPHLKRLQGLNLLMNNFSCHPDMMIYVEKDAAIMGNYKKIIREVKYSDSNPYRDFRKGFYTHDFELTRTSYKELMECSYLWKKTETPYTHFLGCRINEWFRKLPMEMQVDALRWQLYDSIDELSDVKELLSYALQISITDVKIECNEKCHYYNTMVFRLVFEGELKKAKHYAELIREEKISYSPVGLILFLEGKVREALEVFESEIKWMKQKRMDINKFYFSLSGMVYFLGAIQLKESSHYLQLEKTIRSLDSDRRGREIYPSIFFSILSILYFMKGDLKDAKRVINWGSNITTPIPILFHAIASLWVKGRLSSKELNDISDMAKRAHKNGCLWVALECAELLSHTKKKNRHYFQSLADELKEKTGITPIASMIEIEEPWEKKLNALIKGETLNEKKTVKEQDSRLIWLVSEEEDFFDINPREQKRKKNGMWTRGRAVALKRLQAGDDLPLTEYDEKAIKALKLSQDYYSDDKYYFDEDQLAYHLIGHPLIFLNGSTLIPVEFVKGEVEITIQKRRASWHIAFSTPVDYSMYAVNRKSTTQFEVAELTNRHRDMYAILGEKGLSVPINKEKEVLDAIKALSSSVVVHSDLDGSLITEDDTIEEVSASAMPYLHLTPFHEGLKLDLYVKPLGEEGPFLKPGVGNENIILRVNGKKLKTRRNLAVEAENALSIEKACPSLSYATEDMQSWTTDSAQLSLEVLMELKPLQDKRAVTVFWPEGEAFSVSREFSFDHFSMKIKNKTDWFEVEGTLDVDDSITLDIRKLLDLIQDSPHRFIPIGIGKFAALTRSFKKKLLELEAFSTKHKHALKFHSLATMAVDEISENFPHLRSDAAWKKRVKKILSLKEFTPMIPTTLKAELREYQIEGFQWLSRLSEWGVGACLADDMGLGKTVQALAAMLEHAPKGPILVVAPTSVCHIWVTEARRFAPTLQMIMLGGRERGTLIKGLGPFDVLVASYALFQQESALLTPVHWEMIVLDEAQAIKNMTTKRSKAAMQLNGKFKLITTGTPIENHLGELWNLFSFINPGLLHGYKVFMEKFGLPIERDQSREAKKRLKKLIQPFILRRMKSEVLEELPPRTEIVLNVSMTPEESAFYETLRKKALEDIQSDEGSLEKRRFKILAEIMKLRRACCHSSLVLPSSDMKNSKLDLFGTLIDELIENKHKVLVFSQFVDHLSILRAYLDKKKISYCYLDGRTQPSKRVKRVNEFQAGLYDVFLISLKAGGVGLNLTAASYVIHMDPWWNPAVEDQASDRAHRIGQTQPVTVYRLITQDTIEEKMIRLHEKKRDLADSLLEGTDVGGKITAKELMQLIRER